MIKCDINFISSKKLNYIIKTFFQSSEKECHKD